MNLFKHKTPVQLRFKDGDVMGHVNNANHFTFFELTRMHYFKAVVGEDINWSKDGIIIARMTIDYKQPLLITHDVFAYTRCLRLGTKSFDLEHLLVAMNSIDELTIATGVATLVCYDYDQEQSIAIPDGWRRSMEEYDQ